MIFPQYLKTELSILIVKNKIITRFKLNFLFLLLNKNIFKKESVKGKVSWKIFLLNKKKWKKIISLEFPRPSKCKIY